MEYKLVGKVVNNAQIVGFLIAPHSREKRARLKVTYIDHETFLEMVRANQIMDFAYEAFGNTIYLKLSKGTQRKFKKLPYVIDTVGDYFKRILTVNEFDMRMCANNSKYYALSFVYIRASGESKQDCQITLAFTVISASIISDNDILRWKQIMRREAVTGVVKRLYTNELMVYLQIPYYRMSMPHVFDHLSGQWGYNLESINAMESIPVPPIFKLHTVEAKDIETINDWLQSEKRRGQQFAVPPQ